MTFAAVLLPALLFQSGDSLESLLERLRTEDAAARRQAQVELLRRGPAAVPALIQALETASPRPEAEIAALVGRLGSPSWKERNEATAALVRLGRSAVASLEARLTSADPEAAWRLRAAVAEIREKAGQDEQAEELRAAAICDVLGQVGDGRAAGALLRLLADRSEKNVHLKRSCAAALAAIGRPRGIRALVDALAAEDVYVRQGATSALEGTGADLSGYDPRAGEEENRAALARVRAWGATKFGAAWDE